MNLGDADLPSHKDRPASEPARQMGYFEWRVRAIVIAFPVFLLFLSLQGLMSGGRETRLNDSPDGRWFVESRLSAGGATTLVLRPKAVGPREEQLLGGAKWAVAEWISDHSLKIMASDDLLLWSPKRIHDVDVTYERLRFSRPTTLASLPTASIRAPASARYHYAGGKQSCSIHLDIKGPAGSASTRFSLFAFVGSHRRGTEIRFHAMPPSDERSAGVRLAAAQIDHPALRVEPDELAFRWNDAQSGYQRTYLAREWGDHAVLQAIAAGGFTLSYAFAPPLKVLSFFIEAPADPSVLEAYKRCASR